MNDRHHRVLAIRLCYSHQCERACLASVKSSAQECEEECGRLYCRGFEPEFSLVEQSFAPVDSNVPREPVNIAKQLFLSAPSFC